MELRVKCASLGQQVKKARDQRHLTQQETAAELGVALRSLQNWEAGAVVPRAKHRRLILAWLNGDAA